MGKEDIVFLKQLVKSLEESESKLEEYHQKKDYESFIRIKRFIIKIQGKISEVIDDI